MIVLASNSPRRKELLKDITENFVIKSSDIDETVFDNLEIYESLKKLSFAKAEPFVRDGDIVIGADTVVVANGKKLGKPKGEKEAFEMLKMLSGKTHSVITGVTIASSDKTESFCCETKVTFFELSDDEIKKYIKTNDCFDKAGAYGIQSGGKLFVEKIDGDYFNVVGLPVSLLARKLKDFQNI